MIRSRLTRLREEIAWVVIRAEKWKCRNMPFVFLGFPAENHEERQHPRFKRDIYIFTKCIRWYPLFQYGTTAVTPIRLSREAYLWCLGGRRRRLKTALLSLSVSRKCHCPRYYNTWCRILEIVYTGGSLREWKLIGRAFHSRCRKRQNELIIYNRAVI